MICWVFLSIENKHALDLLQIYSTFSALCDVYCHFNATSYKKKPLKRPENSSTISDYHDTRKKSIVNYNSHVQLTSHLHARRLLACEVGLQRKD